MKTNYFVCGTIMNDIIYWKNRDDGDFCCFDLKTNKFKYLYTEDLIIDKMKFSAVICADNNYVYGTSESGKYFWKYSILQNKTYIYEINCEGYALDWICNSVLTDSYLAIIPSRAEVVIWIDVNHGDVIVKDVDNNIIEKDHRKRVFVNEKVLLGQINYNNKLMSFNYKNSYVLEVDYETQNINTISYPEQIGKISDVEYINGFFYILNEQGTMYTWDLKTDQICFIGDGYCGMERIFENKETIWLLPRCGKYILNVDLKGKLLQKYEYPPDTRLNRKAMYDPYMTNNGYKIEDDKRKCFTSYGCNYLFLINKQTNIGEFHDCFNYDKENMKLYYKKYKEDLFYEENKNFEVFVDYISTDL